MTLKEFAQHRGVSEKKARAWKKEGKITQDAQGVWRPVVLDPAAPTLEDRIAQLEAENGELRQWRAQIEEKLANLGGGGADQ